MKGQIIGGGGEGKKKVLPKGQRERELPLALTLSPCLPAKLLLQEPREARP